MGPVSAAGSGSVPAPSALVHGQCLVELPLVLQERGDIVEIFGHVLCSRQFQEAKVGQLVSTGLAEKLEQLGQCYQLL